MARRVTKVSKVLSAANLATLGADRLSELLIEVSGSDAGWKRRLRMELAAEVGAPDLALEIDKRMNTLATSRARVSWRKRPELIADLQTLRRMIVDRLAAMDAGSGLTRLVGWFDLYPGLASRVKDSKGELALLFDGASQDLAAVASAADPAVSGPLLGEALMTRLSEWGAWVGRGAPHMEPELAGRLLAVLTLGRPRPTGRLALVVRKLADRSGDVDAWIAAFPDEDQHKPEVGAEIARRLANAGRAAEARIALDGARAVAAPSSRWSRTADTEPPPEAWFTAEIAVLDAEGRTQDATEARWAMFERTLSAEVLRALLAALPDFEDVVALDRAMAFALEYPDANRALAFLMLWPAYREAAGFVMARHSELRGSTDDVPLWASRLEGRYPAAALLLVRLRAVGLARLAGAMTDEVAQLIAEAAAMLEVNAQPELATHEVFLEQVQAAIKPPRRGWR
ncbi:DUF6880 family protein [Brevundimonas sp.]|uniref:DUF6880 family protein n=1 Tax=Brevundimonas sp. TaxID=1871086 RepID=UPI003BAD1E14